LTFFPGEGAFARPYSFEDCCDGKDHHAAQDGIDVRTYIATAALQGLLANSITSNYSGYPTLAADLAARHADALIAELNK
jgi:hypothetical protein